MLILPRAAARAATSALLICALPAAWAQASGSKTELARNIVQLQQPAVENMARQLVEMPAAQLLQQAGPVLQQKVAADKRESVGREIQGDARRYVEDALPIVRDRAVKLAPEVLAPLLESKLSEDELKHVLHTMQMMEAPAFRKYVTLDPEIRRAFTERLVGDVRGSVEPKLKALEESVGKRLGVNNKPASPPAGGNTAPKK